jgi:mannose-6-phosphate isomerase-like protein (cupin superfamily)
MRALPLPTEGDRAYVEFFRSPDLSVGIYRLGVGENDEQRPHTEDEVYYVIRGRAKFTGGGQTIDVAPRLCLFVSANETHKFHDIVEPLEVLVFFGPAEGERAMKVTV